MSSDTGVTAEGARLIANWKHAVERVNRADEEKKKATRELVVAENELGKWLCPGDKKSGENFCVWYGDSIIACRYDIPSDRPYTVTLRTRGRSFTQL